jgi:hypothetical protein
MNYIFQMSVDTALEFWERVVARNAQTEEERQDILIELVQEGKVDAVSKTNRSKEQILKDAKKNYGNVLNLTNIKDEELQ